jgi:hypothetical protein
VLLALGGKDHAPRSVRVGFRCESLRLAGNLPGEGEERREHGRRIIASPSRGSLYAALRHRRIDEEELRGLLVGQQACLLTPDESFSQILAL